MTSRLKPFSLVGCIEGSCRGMLDMTWRATASKRIRRVFVCTLCARVYAAAEQAAVVSGLLREPGGAIGYRNRVWLRDRSRCRYCGDVADHLDHVTPASRKGPSTPENLVCACEPCGQKKGARTPEEAGMVLLKVCDSYCDDHRRHCYSHVFAFDYAAE